MAFTASTFVSKLLLPAVPVLRSTNRGAANAKRFYKAVSVAGSPGSFEVNLDHRKLKTPLRNVLQVPTYPLALAIAHEWESVREEIVPAFMHLSGLAYTVVDNPNHLTKFDMVDSILEYIATDTLLFADEESDEFGDLQHEKWWPLVDWFNDRFKVTIEPSAGIVPASLSDQDRATLRRHFLSYDIWAVAGLQFCVEAVKSVILPLAAIERKISALEAVDLSRLEVNYQASRWGRVEWAHDMDQKDLEARFAAGLLFAQLNSAAQHRVAKRDDSAAKHI